ncbi:hypothetical protein [Algibacter mikhailovii]|uniref:hypothetical protein n=1 Tax=Algibacter mikhailovii TaxID=425498 RepID=UPI0024941773|nr:hypothetical protein [Algibacter mikhailovii]
MYNGFSKGFKPFIIKLVVVTLSTCYVLGPAHLEVKKVLHFLAHHIQKPSFVISHSVHDNHTYKNLIAKNKGKLSNVKVEPHSHEIIDWFAGVFKNSQKDKGPLSKYDITFKIDKHIKHKNNRKYQFVAFFRVLETNYALIKDKPCKGFIKYLKEPPILA